MKQTLALLLLLAGSLAEAKNIYVSQNGAGAANGADAADAYPESWLNAPAHWGNGSSQVNPGDTVHLVGTFTNALTIQGSGAAGNPITIYFESGANFTTGCWPGSGAIALNGQSHLTIDGGPNGLIQSTNNGTSLGLQQDSEGIVGQGYFLVIKNLTMTNLYRVNPLVVDQNRYGECIDVYGSSITVSNCNLSDGDGLLSYSGPAPGNGTWSNIFLLNNRLVNFNHGIVIGIGNSSTPPQNCLLTNLVIAGNYIDHSDVWNNAFTNGASTHHLDDIIVFNNTLDPTVVISGARIFGNTFGSYIGSHNTAAIFADLCNPPCQTQNWFIYNNLFLVASNGWGNGFITAPGSNVWVVNNTCMGNSAAGGQISIGGTNDFAYNNILYSPAGINMCGYTGNTNITGTHTAANDLFVLTNYFRSIQSDHNVVIGAQEVDFGLQLYCTDPSVVQFVWNYNGAFHNLLQWQSFDANEWSWPTPIWNSLHCDPESTTNMPAFVAGTEIPGTNDTYARAAGTNLFWLGITNDYQGHPRPATGPWDIGAFVASISNGVYHTVIPAPTGLHLLSAGELPVTPYTGPPVFGTPMIVPNSLLGIRNNFSGAVGLCVQPLKNCTLVQLGRWVVAGNSQSHTLSCYDPTGKLVGLVTVNTAGSNANSFAYGATLIHLSAGTNYSILSAETSGGDQWYDSATTYSFTTSSAWMPISAEYMPAGSVNLSGTGGATYITYGPVNCQYTVP